LQIGKKGIGTKEDVMAKFWLATFEFERTAALMPSVAEPLAGAGSRAWAIEIIYDEAVKEFAVLFSTVDDTNHPTKLVCEFGFANGSKSCSVWRDRGFPLVDAIIKEGGGDLTVCAACFLKPQDMKYEVDLISIKNIMPIDYSDSLAELATSYEQKLQIPNSAFPATRITENTVTWSPQRSSVKELKQPQTQFKVAPSRWPPLPFKDGDRKPNKIWSGIVVLPKWPPDFPHVPVERESRLPIFGKGEFRFEDVEVLGFRIDLTKCGTGDDKRLADGLAELVKPLNFHLDPLTDKNSRSTRSSVSDFQYRPASRTLMLELVRYGKMKLKKPSLPFTLDDFQSQHELMVRILVGRVDDDTAQARDAAIFVPTIFVDNPWSKVMGRCVQGFDKRMADFCILDNRKPTRLLPDGRRLAGDKKPQPLASIAQIHLAKETGKAPSDQVLIELECPYQHIDDWNAFDKIDLNLVFGTFPFPPMRWLQTDFDKAEFSRSFARSAVAKTLRGFRSIQVSPIGERRLQQELNADTTWLTGTFKFDNDMRVARPNGTVRLTFHAEKYAPPAWKALCKLLGKGSISLPTGSWYRVRCSMDLKMDNGLD
jgi:hypothetical protein